MALGPKMVPDMTCRGENCSFTNFDSKSNSATDGFGPRNGPGHFGSFRAHSGSVLEFLLLVLDKNLEIPRTLHDEAPQIGPGAL